MKGAKNFCRFISILLVGCSKAERLIVKVNPSLSSLPRHMEGVKVQIHSFIWALTYLLHGAESFLRI